MGVTIIQIAEEAGVSWSAVSQILNNRGRFTSDTRERVLGVASRLGYRANASARSLRNKNSKLVGVLFRNARDGPLTNMTAFEHLIGVNQRFQDADLSTVLIRANDIVDSTDTEPRMFRERLIDGLIVVGPLSDLMVDRVRELTQRIIWLDGPVWEETCCIRRDEHAAASRCVEALADLGYKKVRFLAREATRLLHHSHGAREKGARDAAHRHRLHFHVTNWPETDPRLEYEALHDLFDPAVGLVVGTIPVTRQIVNNAMSIGKMLGRDYGLVCCDDTADSHSVWRTLSRVGYDRYRLGTRAAEMMLSLLNDPTIPPKSLLVKDEWLPGCSAYGPPDTE